MNIDEVKALYIFEVDNIDDDSQYDEVQKVKKIFKDVLGSAYDFCTNVEDYTNMFNTRHHIETTDDGIKLHIDFKNQDVKFKNYISHLSKQKDKLSDEQFLSKIKKDLRLSFRWYDGNDFQKIDAKTLEKSLDKDKIINDMVLVYESQRFTFIDRLDKKLKQYKDKKYGVQFSESNGANNMSFSKFLSEGVVGHSNKTSLNEAKISTNSDLLTDVYAEIFGNQINEKIFLVYEEIADTLGVDYDYLIESIIDVFKEKIKSQKGYWQLAYVVQEQLLQGIVDALEDQDINADYDVSSPSYPSLVVNGDEVKTLKEFKEILKELEKDED